MSGSFTQYETQRDKIGMKIEKGCGTVQAT